MTDITEAELFAALKSAHAQLEIKLAPGEFTAAMYSQANGVTNHIAVATMNAGVKAGLFVFVDKRTIDGHATNVYRLDKKGM